MQRTFVYKLRLTRAQEAACEKTLETCRRLYCDALAERKQAWELEKRSVSLAQQSAALPILKERSEDLPRVYSQVLQDVLRRVERSFQGFYRRCKRGEKPGYPRFKGRGAYHSFTYPQWGRSATLKDGRLVLPTIGRVRFYADRLLDGQPKTCTIVRKADGWYAHVVCKVELAPLPVTGETIGVDLGLESFATLSTGEQIANPRHYYESEKALKRAQQRLSRRQHGSQRRRKARVLLAKAHLKVKRARLDFCHKVAFELVQRFDVIAVEKLNVRGMVKNHHMAKSILDAGWFLFLEVLRHKAARAGRGVEEVNPTGTSQICSNCGETVPKKLAQRWHSCPHCACEMHRDHNAARNIHKKGGGTAVEETLALAAS